ncbi:ribonuclease HI [Trypanosoma cruzi]|nr:ribonuclease HI [Trypanosoma cruzi]
MLRRNRQLHSRLRVDGRSRQPDAGDKSRSCFRLQPFTVENEHTAASTGASGPVVLEPRRAGTSGFRAGASSSHSTRKKHFLVIELHAPRQALRQREAGGVPPHPPHTGTGFHFHTPTQQ